MKHQNEYTIREIWRPKGLFVCDSDWCFLITRASLARCFHFSISRSPPPSFTAISRIPLSPIFRSQACNYVGLLVCVCVCASGRRRVAQGVLSNLPLRAGASITRWVSLSHARAHTHTYVYTNTVMAVYRH